MAMSIDTPRDQIKILKYYKKFLTMQESSISQWRFIQKWKKVLWKYLKNGLQLQIEP